MAMNTSPTFPHGINNGFVQIAVGDTTAKKTLITGAADGTRVRMMSAVSDDSADKTVIVTRKSGGTSYRVSETLIPDGAGTNGTDKAVDLMNTTDMPWLKDGILYLGNGEILEVSVKATVTNGKYIEIVAEGQDY